MEDSKEMTMEEIQKELELCGLGDCAESGIEYMPVAEPLILDEKELTKLQKTDEFQRGIKKGAYFAGMFTALASSGLCVKGIQEMLMNEMVSINNLEMSKNQIEMAKFSFVNKDSAEV